jgi:mono/diheme cytochrome c family protein
MKRLRLFGVLFALSGALTTAAIAEDAARSGGESTANHVCSACHVVPDQPWAPLMNPPAPSFRAIANLPDTTAASLRAFLRTTHKTVRTYKDMPPVNLTDDQADAVVHYILSLRTPR